MSFYKKQIFSLILGLLFFFSNSVFAFNERDSTLNTDDKQLYISVHTSWFLKNNEYFGSFTKGFTGIGYILQPKLRYDFGSDIYAHVGIHLLHYSGRYGYNQYIPLFRFSLPLSENIKLLAGHLEGTLAHNLSEPLYRYDIWYQDNVEYGLQFLADYEKWNADLWLDWEIFIEPGDDFKEQFIVGLTSDLNFYQTDQFSINWPAELMIRHRGGQIDISPERVENFFNASTGLRFNYLLIQERTLSIEGRYYHYGSNSRILPIISGSAFYLFSTFENKSIQAFIGYWQATNWAAFKGETLFQSVSDFNPMHLEKNRKLLNAKFFYRKKLLPTVQIKLGAEAYYDLINSRMDHAMLLFIKADIQRTLLKRTEKNLGY